ncbi:uncharacterized protein [Apostichopus japonicus]|uniref:uncharacterized protein isoform X2 n=1 Tax=Stichopus japonicus TaxID=307972 RepID=UPI003AB86232
MLTINVILCLIAVHLFHFSNVLGQTAPCSCSTELHECVTSSEGVTNCSCLTGYAPVENNREICEDINECGLIDNVCDPDTSSCLNLAGSYTCICQAGYTKDDIDMVCVPFPTCPPNENLCPSPHHDCFVAEEGNRFCTCTDGYMVSLFNPNRCDDINECSQTVNPCDPLTSTCVNTQGSYECVCHDGFHNGPTGSNTCVQIRSSTHPPSQSSSLSAGSSEGTSNNPTKSNVTTRTSDVTTQKTPTATSTQSMVTPTIGTTTPGSSVSATVTNTPTATATQSMGTLTIGTITPGSSVSATGTNTPTVTATQSMATPTIGTTTPGSSVSETGTNTPTGTATQSMATPTIGTTTPGSSVSETGTNTPTATATQSTGTPTIGTTTPGSSVSETGTNTPTGSATQSMGTPTIGTTTPGSSVSETGTNTPTATVTQSMATPTIGTTTPGSSVSETGTNTPTGTATQSMGTPTIGTTTPGSSVSATGTNTPTATATQSMGTLTIGTTTSGSSVSATGTNTPTATATQSMGTLTIGTTTPGSSVSETGTNTPTASATQSMGTPTIGTTTPGSSVSATGTNTQTATSTQSMGTPTLGTATPGSSVSATGTNTPTATATQSMGTPTLGTATPGSSVSATGTNTPTATSTQSMGTPTIGTTKPVSSVSVSGPVSSTSTSSSTDQASNISSISPEMSSQPASSLSSEGSSTVVTQETSSSGRIKPSTSSLSTQPSTTAYLSSAPPVGLYVAMALSTVSVSERDDVVSIPILIGPGVRFDVDASIIVIFSTEDVTARNGIDFLLETDSIRIPFQNSLDVTIISDNNAEEDETFKVHLIFTDRQNVMLLNTTTTVHINNDDSTCILIQDIAVEEDNTEASVVISLPNSFDNDITVELAIFPITATAGEDFIAIPPTSVIIPASETEIAQVISIINDDLTEGNERFDLVATAVTSPLTICNGISTGEITILANDPGPVVDYCPSDITYYTVDRSNSVIVTWDAARFSRGQDQISSFTGLDSLQGALLPGESLVVRMTATDQIGRTSICSFTVSVVISSPNDLKMYNVTATISTYALTQSFAELDFQKWMNDHYREGICTREFAGAVITEYLPDQTVVKYNLFLVTFSQCCVQDIIKDFDDRLTDLSLISPDGHLPEVVFYRFEMSMEVDNTVVDVTSYVTDQPEKTALSTSLSQEITVNLTSTDGFIGVCFLTFREGSIISRFAIELISSVSADNNKLNGVKQQLMSFASTSLSLPTGIMLPEERNIFLTQYCPETKCGTNGQCYLPVGGYIPKCMCDVGFTQASDCRERDFDFCTKEVNLVRESDGLIVNLPSGKLGETLLTLDPNPCPDQSSDDILQILYATCSRNPDNTDTVWDIQFINCNATLDAYLSYLLNRTISNENINDVSGQLANASTKLETEGGMQELQKVAQLVGSIANTTGPKDAEVVDNLSVTVSNIITVEQDTLDQLNDNGTLNTIAQALEQGLADVIVNNVTGTYSKQTPNIATMVIEGNPAILDDFGIGTFSSSEDVLVTGGGPVTESIQQVNASRVNRDIGMNATSLFIFPSQLRSQLTPDKTTRITFAVYGTPALFSSRYFNDINGNREMFGRRIKRNFGPSTRVVSSTVLSDDKVIREWNGMNGTFQQWYRVLNRDSTTRDFETASCTFWNFNADGGRGNWSTDGCRLANFDPELNTVMCECTHLTNFAVLLDIYEHDSLTDTQYTILEAITFFGCATSIIGLGVTIMAFISQRRLREKRPSQILIWLCFSLLGLYVSFLIMAAFDSERTRRLLPPLQCNILAGVTHFFTLSSLCWMAVEGVNMYYLFVRIVNNHINYFMLKAVLFAEGVPLIIVGITYVITSVILKQDYAQASVCFVSKPFPLLGGVAIPIGILMIINVVLFVLVIRRLSNRVQTSSSAASSKRRRREQVKRLQNAVSIFLLMGLSWGVGYLCFIPLGDNFAFSSQVLFVGLNSMQGYLIFMFYCMRNPDFRKRWRRWCFCLCPSTFPFKQSLSSSFLSTFSKRTQSSQPLSFNSKNVPVSIVEKRGRLRSFRNLDSSSQA